MLEGDAVDPEEGPLPDASLAWRLVDPGSGSVGIVGTGRRVTIPPPAAGTYLIYLRATDTYGATKETHNVGSSMLVGPFGPCLVSPPSMTPAIMTIQAGATSTVEFTGYRGGNPRVRLEDGADAVVDVAVEHSIEELGSRRKWLLTLEAQNTLPANPPYELQIAIYYHEFGPPYVCRAPLSVDVLDAAANQPPVVSVSSPLDRAFYPGEAILFDASVVDAEDGRLSGSAITWESSRDGVIGTGESFQRTDLSYGDHAITVTVTDSQGAEARGYADFDVLINSKPEGVITAPLGGQSFAVGESVTFRGSATDTHDGPLTGPSLVWTSSLDGVIGTGETFVRTDLTFGIHDVALTVTDSQGLANTTSVTINVVAPSTGTIIGAVSVSSGSGLPTPLVGVTITIAGPVNQTALSNAFGQFFFFNMPPGTYTVSISGYPTSVTFPFTTTTVTVLPGQEAVAVFTGQ